MATKTYGGDENEVWREFLETGLKALAAGNLKVAEVALLDCLKHARDKGGADSQLAQTVEVVSEVAARIYFDEEESRAVELCEEVIQAGYPILGGQHPSIYTCACILADRYFDEESEHDTTPRQRVLDELSDILTQASHVVEYEDAEMVGNGVYMLASLYYSSEQYATAERLMRITLALRDIAPPQLRAALLQDYELFVNALCWQSKFDEAEEATARWIALASEELAEDDLYIAQIWLTLAEIYRMTGRDPQAEDLYNQAIKLHELAECEDCLDMATILRAYARFLQGIDRIEEAHEIEERAARIPEAGDDWLTA